MKREERGVGGYMEYAKCNFWRKKMNVDFYRKIVNLRISIFSSITKVSRSLEKYISLMVYKLNLNSVSGTVW